MMEAPFEELDECAEEVSLKRSLWVSGSEWAEFVEKWAQMQFEAINVSQMEEVVQRFSKLCFKIDHPLNA